MGCVIIGISGKKNSGKNTLAGFIKESLGPNISCLELAFADALKDEVAKLNHISRAQLEIDKAKYRSQLQDVGVKRRETSGIDYWIIQVFKKILKTEYKVYLVTDVRFLNEASYLKEAGAILVRVNRHTGIVDNHISETDLDSYNFEFTCDNQSLSTLQNFGEMLAAKIRYQLLI